MWIPTPVYERLPLFLFLAGVLFMSSGLYLGFDHPYTFLYFGTGFACSVWGVCVFIMRRLHRNKSLEQQVQSEPAETSEETSSL